jgi:hypothetical protein
MRTSLPIKASLPVSTVEHWHPDRKNMTEKNNIKQQ